MLMCKRKNLPLFANILLASLEQLLIIIVTQEFAAGEAEQVKKDPVFLRPD